MNNIESNLAVVRLFVIRAFGRALLGHMLVRDLLVVVIEVHSVFPFQLAQLVVGVGFLALRRAFCVFVEERQCVIVPVCLFSAVDFVVQVCEQATSFPHYTQQEGRKVRADVT